jgi:hypothetical protein
MSHVKDDDLILYHYGEAPGAGDIESHLVDCERCREALTALRNDLAVVDRAAVPERDAAYPSRVWLRLHHRLAESPEPESRWAIRRWFAPRRVVFAASVAVLMVAAFIAGRWNGQALPSSPIPEQVRERILFVAVGDHLDRSQRLLIELVNAAGDDAKEWSLQQDRAARLASENRLYRRTALGAGDEQIVELLEELERTLIEIANAPSESARAELAELRRRIAKRGILFKVRVIGEQTRRRGLEGTRPGAGEV